MLSKTDALDVAQTIMRTSAREDARLNVVNQYLRGTYPSAVFIPTNPSSPAAHREYLGIIKRSRVPVLSLVVDALAQNLYVDGYRPDRSAENAAGWEHWQANRMDARQAGLHRAAIAYGASYLVILPGDPVPVWRPVSPRRMRAVYSDRLNDEWPEYALEEWTEGTKDGPRRRFRLYDAEAVYHLAGGPANVIGGQSLELGDIETHSTGLCPVVRYIGEPDLDDEIVGEIEPLIPLQEQLDASTFYVEMAQQFAVHRQRWVTGMAIPEDDNGQPVEPFKVAIDRMLVAEDADTKFGEFEQTDIKSWLDAREATLRHIAIKSQTPPGSLLGQMINLSAEALAAAEAPQQRRGSGYKTSLGESHEQAFRLDAKQAGDDTGWADTSAQVVWRDTESRSLSQVADALGKLASQLGIPARGLWEKIPGITDQDLDAWEAMRGDELRMAADAQARSIGMVIDSAPTDAAIS